MASSSNICDRNSRRTLSAGESISEEQDQENVVSKPRRNSVQTNDLITLEDIVTCSIHLGIMVNPRKLQCQHSFCSDCLVNLLRSSETISCPICRAVEKCNDVSSLPYALVEKQLIELVMQKRIAGCIESKVDDHNLSKEGKEELVNHLLKELKSSSSGIFKFNDAISEAAISSTMEHDRDLRIQPSVSSAGSSTYDMMDLETIRENLLNQSWYEDVKHNCIKKILKGYPHSKHCRNQPDFTTFDIHLLGEEADAYEIILVDSNSNKFYVHSAAESRSFVIHLDGVVFKPLYIRVIRDDIFVTGSIRDHGLTYSLFIQSNLYGKIIRRSDRCQNIHPGSTLQTLCGFDVDERTEKYFVCTPNSCSVQVYNTSLVDCRQKYEFDDYRPEFVSFYHHQNQIWVSCPEDRRILIADIDSGAFMMFRTDRIGDAIPKMIFCTDDDRIIFLDSRSNRFIWIKRRGDYILTQKLHFRSIGEDLSVIAFQVLPNSMLVIGTTSTFLVFQPVKLKSKPKAGFMSCALL